MALTVFANVCPADCSTEFDFLNLDTDQNCAGTPYLSQVTDLWMQPTGGTATAVSPFTGWTSVLSTITATAAAIDNSVADNTKTKWVTGIGSVDVPEKQVVRVHKFLDVTLKRRFALVFEVFNLSDANREFLFSLQCNPTNYRFWYGNTSHVFGKDTGIIPVYTNVDFPLGAGEADLEKATITVNWESKTDPERRNNPYA
jgi:hypothetical protein